MEGFQFISDGEDYFDRGQHGSVKGYGSESPSFRRAYFRRRSAPHFSDDNDGKESDSRPTHNLWPLRGYYEDEFDHRYQGFMDHEQYYDKYRASRGFVNSRLRRKATGSRKGRMQLKKRIYFCTLCSLLDIRALHDYLEADFFAASTWSFYLVGDCLRLYKQSGGDAKKTNNGDMRHGGNINAETEVEGEYISERRQHASADLDMPSDVLKTQEIFIFDFGACVFWGFHPGEEVPLLRLIRSHCKEGMVQDEEFKDGEDDMHFVVMTRDHNSYADVNYEYYDRSTKSEEIAIKKENKSSKKIQRIHFANDCVMLPERNNAKQRLAISYALAQSSLLTLMETQIENRMDEYEHIPLALAKGATIKLSSTQLGKMIGEILLLRHEVNLHSDLLGIPDFFWEEDEYVEEYNLSRQYFEMELRIDIFNKRLNLLKQLVSVVNGQLINVHGKYRTEIIIATIFIYVIIFSVQQFSPFLLGIQLV